MAAGLSSRAISVAPMSKAYGLPGLRIGWAVTTDPGLRKTILAAKEQMIICGATIDEHIAGRVLADRDRILPPILRELRERVAAVQAWLDAQSIFEWVPRVGELSDSFASAPTWLSTPAPSIVICWLTTALTSGQVIGSRSATGTSGSATPGPHRPNYATASPD
jgi:hypothetical protein